MALSQILRKLHTINIKQKIAKRGCTQQINGFLDVLQDAGGTMHAATVPDTLQASPSWRPISDFEMRMKFHSCSSYKVVPAVTWEAVLLFSQIPVEILLRLCCLNRARFVNWEHPDEAFKWSPLSFVSLGAPNNVCMKRASEALDKLWMTIT